MKKLNYIKVCTCKQCKCKKENTRTNVKARIKRQLNKKLRKMDLENPEYVNFYWA